MKDNHGLNKVTPQALLVAFGIIYDIGTSPLYVMKAIIGEGSTIREVLILGGFSCIFWTLTLQTTLKYVVLTLRADNNGEGGIFAFVCFGNLRIPNGCMDWLFGGSTLLADGIITPPISVSSAVEGLRLIDPNIETVPIVIGILTGLFLLQGFGTKTVGRLFGPIMMLWFVMLAVLGIGYISKDLTILKASLLCVPVTGPVSGRILAAGRCIWRTTGAEALYSDLGHCGRNNIRVSWIFVKSCLLLN